MSLVMEPKHILAAFENVVSTGPVLIVANMADPSHGGTKDPIIEFSPLLRAAVVAANLGARAFTFDVDNPEIVAAVYMYMAHDTAAHAAIARSGVPALGLHFCSLNGWMTVCEVSQAGVHADVDVKAERNDAFRTNTIDIVDFAEIKLGNPVHQNMLGEAKMYFERQGWAVCGRVFVASTNPPTARPRPWEAGPRLTIAEAQVQADAREAEFAETLKAKGDFEGYRERCAANKAGRMRP